MKKVVVLYVLEDEIEKPRCLGRVPYDGDANLEGFRAFLEGYKEEEPRATKRKANAIVPWPFDFWDSKLNTRIATGLEPWNTLELHDHAITVIRSHGGQSVAGEESMAILKPTTVASLTISANEQSETCPLIPSLATEPVACAPSSSQCEEDLQEETSCPELEPKHKIFLSHSGAQKPFVEQLCIDLERQNHFPFFDQRDECLPKGKKFSTLIFEAAKQCQVAVVVLSPEYLKSKWPMVELVEFVRAKIYRKKNLELFPVFYKASVDDLSDKSIEEKWRPQWEKLVQRDKGDSVKEWAAAVRGLHGVNGPRLEQFGGSEPKLRDDIVKQIFKLAPPDLLFDTSKISGGDRIRMELEGKFVRHTGTSADVLGVYGVGGLGKTTMSQSLCNHFSQQYSGRVCYIDIKEEAKALERQQMVMRKLLQSSEVLLQRQCDISEGWGILRKRMKEYPVFLVIDNVQADEVSKKEAREYLNVGYHSSSKILVISRSSDVVEDVLGGSHYCHPMPFMTSEEAVKVFLQHVDPSMGYSFLTRDERAVVLGCMKEACFSDGGNEGCYHPMALMALGVYFRRWKTANVLSWGTCLPEYGKLKSTEGSYIDMLKVLGLHFNDLDGMTQIMFLDICLFASKALESRILSNSPLEDLIAWLAVIHGKETMVVKSKIYEFKGLGMLSVNEVKSIDSQGAFEVIVHDLYIEYATWFLGMDNREKEVQGVWCVGGRGEPISSLPPDLLRTPRELWPDLGRIRLENVHCDGFAAGKVQEWRNVVVLQIVGCGNLTSINLHGLTCLCHLELKDLKSLKSLMFTTGGSSSTSNMSSGTFQKSVQIPRMLKFVIIEGLGSLECLPSFSPCTSLKFLEVLGCRRLTQPPSVQGCALLERMVLEWHPNQKTLPRLYGLTSLRDLTIFNFSRSFEGEPLNIEGLGSLISLGALELYNIPVGRLAGLENLAHVEYISLIWLSQLTSFPSLVNVETSSLHVLEVSACYFAFDRGEEMKLQRLIQCKLDDLAQKGQVVPHTPSKIGSFCPELEPNHKIFLSHSGTQIPFVEHLCLDLESQNCFSFFDHRDESLPRGKKFSTLILRAAKQCQAAVLVLSPEYLSSKWPMLELVEFVRAKRSTNKNLELFPVFYKASVDDLSDKSIEEKWRPQWEKLVQRDKGDSVEEWAAAVRGLRGVNGPRLEQFGGSEVKLREDIVKRIFKLAPPD